MGELNILFISLSNVVFKRGVLKTSGGLHPTGRA